MSTARKIILLLCAFFVSSLPTRVFGTDWNSFIVNFDKNLYGKGIQTW